MPTHATTISPDDTLWIPKKRRLLHALEPGPDGEKVFYLYYGTKEICFDEPEMIPFGQQLVLQDRFVAEAATRWSPTAPYPWTKVQDALEILLEQGILAYAGEDPSEHGKSHATDTAPSAPSDPRPSEHCLKMVLDRRFDEQWPMVTEHFLGRALSASYLEFFVPVFLLSTSAVDEEGRQLGEANVLPDALRFPIPTEWRTCRYSGSRYLDDRPMNVSALKIMNGHWPFLLSITSAMRKEFLRRRGKSPSEPMNVGEVHLFACSASSVPAYLMLRRENPVLNGRLPSVVASIMRVMFGIRMTAQHMLARTDLPHDKHTLVTVEEFLNVTDRDCLYLGRGGVCAGPQRKMEEVVELILVGREEVEPLDLASVVGDVDEFHTYVARGMSVYAATATFGIQTELLNERLLQTLADVPPSTPGLGELRQLAENAMVDDRPLMQPGSAGLRSRLHIELFDELGGVSLPEGVSTKTPGLFGALDEATSATHRQDVATLLGRTLDTRARPSGTLETIAGVFVDYWFTERRALQTIRHLQQQVNELCGRATEIPSLSTHDLETRSAISDRTRIPRLWFEALGISAESTASRSRIEFVDGTQLVLE